MASKRRAPSRVRKDSTAHVVEQRFDGWGNVLTGLGTPTRDKRIAGVRYYADDVDPETAEQAWRSDDMHARVVETLPRDMLRRGYSIDITPEDKQDPGEVKDLSEAVTDAVQALDERASMEEKGGLQTSLEYERAHGGGALLLGAKDGRDFAEPLNEDGIKSIEWMTVLEGRRELVALSYYADPTERDYGRVRTYQLQSQIGAGSGPPPKNGGMVREIHESRLIVFPGLTTSKRQRQANLGWGDSVLVRIQQVLADFHSGWQSAGAILSEFATTVFKVKGLAQILMNGEGEKLKNRITAIDMMRSTIRSIMVDADGEDMRRDAAPIAGLAEMLDKVCLRLSAAADLTQSQLMGQAPAGLNATGDSDIRWYYDRVEAKREANLRPRIERLARIVMLAKNGPTGGVLPAKWCVKFPPLWQPTEKEKAEVYSTVANADAQYLDRGVITPAEVAITRFGGDAYEAGKIVLDMDMRSVNTTPEAFLTEKPEPQPTLTEGPGEQDPEADPEQGESTNPEANQETPSEDKPAAEEKPEEKPEGDDKTPPKDEKSKVGKGGDEDEE